MGFEEGADAFVVEGVAAWGYEEGLADRDCEEADTTIGDVGLWHSLFAMGDCVLWLGVGVCGEGAKL